MYIRLCPSCNCEINYTSKSNYNRANKSKKSCKSCAQQRIKNEDWYFERNNKISIARIDYWKEISQVDKDNQINKMAKSISEKYKNRPDEWKENWKLTCSRTSKEKWSDQSYKEKVSNKIKENNWSKRNDKDDIIEKSISTKIERYGTPNGSFKPIRCKEFIVKDLICQGTHEKFYIESLIADKKVLPTNTNSIKTIYGYYKPDFEHNDFFVDVKSIFTLKVLLGLLSYSKNKKSNPKQLSKMKYISDNIKPVRILLVDIIRNKLLELSIEQVINLNIEQIENIFDS